MTEHPSTLAIKLAARFHPKGPDAAAEVDNVLQWHHIDEREAERRANRLLPQFCSNVGVYHSRKHCVNHWFELQLMPPEGDAIYQVQFKRYATPGRYWIYAFHWIYEGSGRVIWGSESGQPLGKDLAMLQADLDKPQVLDLFRDALSAERVVCRYHRDLTNLLRALAPRSKAARLTERLVRQTFETRKARLVAEGKIKATTPLPV